MAGWSSWATGQARAFRAQFAPGCELYTDPDARTYRAIGSRRGVIRTLGPGTWRDGVRALRQGFRQSATQGAAVLEGGVLVMLPGDSVAWSYLSERAGDHPEPDDILAALRGAGGSGRRAGGRARHTAV